MFFQPIENGFNFIITIFSAAAANISLFPLRFPLSSHDTPPQPTKKKPREEETSFECGLTFISVSKTRIVKREMEKPPKNSLITENGERIDDGSSIPMISC